MILSRDVEDEGFIMKNGKNVFFEEITDWNSWGKVFQSIPAFEKLIKRIFEREGLLCKEISHLTAGSNAVFRVDDFVVKIFAPVESGFDTEIDYNCEVLGMKRAIGLGINIPNVIASSFIEDNYLFRYIIMDYIDGSDAKKIIKHYSANNKIALVRQLKENINKMNTAVHDKFPSVDVKERALTNPRWNVLSSTIVAQIHYLIRNYDMQNKVYVHGDITGDNVMISQSGKLYIIDFADGRIAPEEYEFPPILFDLFDFDKLMITEFIGEQNIEQFVERCFYGVLMHEFGAEFVNLICERIMGMRASKLTNILQIKEALLMLLARQML
jgi:tRNA A-37 threonylcarbamoyl transferase component Bud32